MTWLTEEGIDNAEEHLVVALELGGYFGRNPVRDDLQHAMSLARWALRAREWIVGTDTLHSPQCAAGTRARGAACVCGLYELMEEAK